MQFKFLDMHMEKAELDAVEEDGKNRSSKFSPISASLSAHEKNQNQ